MDYMFASIVTDDRCDLYTVRRTDRLLGSAVDLTYPLTDYMTAVERAAHYQQEFDPTAERYVYRVTMCS